MTTREACPSCASLTARAERAEQERTDLQTQLQALQAQHTSLKTQLRDGIRALEQEMRTMSDGVEREQRFSKEARAYSDAKALTLRWVADRLARLCSEGEPSAKAAPSEASEP